MKGATVGRLLAGYLLARQVSAALGRQTRAVRP